MILISFVLVVVAIVTLAVASWIVQELWLIYVSIGISIVAAVFLAIGTFRGRDEIFGRGAAAGPRKGARSVGSGAAKTKAAKAKGDAPSKAASRPARAGAGGRTARDVDWSGGGARGKQAATSAPAPEVPADATVVVVPGRKRYHLSNCRQLAGRTREELTYEEARDEGFTPCMACMPDAALAARATTSEVPQGPEAPQEPLAEEASQHDAAQSSDEDADVADTDERSDTKDSDPDNQNSDSDSGEMSAPTEEFAAVSGTADDGEAADRHDDRG